MPRPLLGFAFFSFMDTSPRIIYFQYIDKGVIAIGKRNVPLKIVFINPNSQEEFEKILKQVAIEKLKSIQRKEGET